MVARAVTFNGTRANDSDSNTNWSNLGGGGPAPASEAQLRYQYSGTGTVGVVNRKVTSSGARQGIQYDHSGTASFDMTGTTNPLWFFKGYITDFGDLNATYGCEARIGSAAGAYYDYNIAGTGANRSVYTTYPSQGGYLITAINPTIAAWREGTTGSPVTTAIDYFAFAAHFIAGTAKSENLALDAIDVGAGLTITLGTGADPDGNFIDFLEVDQDTIANRWGVVNGVDPVINARGKLTIGDSGGTETDFTDASTTVLFDDGYHGPGDIGVVVNMQNASSVINISNTLIGVGSITTSDTRPDFTVSGTTGTLNLAPVMTNFRNVTFTSVAAVDGADIQADDITVGGSEIQNSIIRTTSASTVATINDAAFGTTSGIHDVEFIEEGAGHAIELTTATTYTFTNITFTDYGGTPGTNISPSTGANNAAIYNSSGGAITINVSGGNSPSVRNAASSTTTVVNTVTLTLTGIETDSEVVIVNEDDVTNFDKELAASEQISGSVQSVLIVDGGTGYSVSDTLTISGGTGTAATLTVTSVSGGVITGVSIAGGGSYTANPPNPASVTGGTGSSATFRLDISGQFTYDYDSSFNPTVAIVVFHIDFVEVRILQQLASTSQTIPIQQRTDRVYNNP